MYGAASYGAVSSGAPTYEVTVQPLEFPVTLDELKAWLNMTAANTSQDGNLTEIIAMVTKNAERYTKRDFIAKTYLTYRDGLYQGQPVQLRRTPTTSIDSIQYLNDDAVLTTIDSSVYYFTKTNGSEFSLVLPNPQQAWPQDILFGRLQSVEILFIAGWADAADFKERWADLWQALLIHMAYVFQNRGDCSVANGCQCSAAPAEALMVYNQYLIVDFALGDDDAYL